MRAKQRGAVKISGSGAIPGESIPVNQECPPSDAQKKAREIWFLCRQYNAQQALEMGMVNTVVPLKKLEEETLQWSREMLQHSPMALRCLKSALNADCDGQAGLQELAGNATMLFYMSEEGQEGRNAYLEKRKPDFKTGNQFLEGLFEHAFLYFFVFSVLFRTSVFDGFFGVLTV